MNVCVVAAVERDADGDLKVAFVHWTEDPTPEEVNEALYNGDPRDIENLEKRYEQLLKTKECRDEQVR